MCSHFLFQCRSVQLNCRQNATIFFLYQGIQLHLSGTAPMCLENEHTHGPTDLHNTTTADAPKPKMAPFAVPSLAHANMGARTQTQHQNTTKTVQRAATSRRSRLRLPRSSATGRPWRRRRRQPRRGWLRGPRRSGRTSRAPSAGAGP